MGDYGPSSSTDARFTLRVGVGRLLDEGQDRERVGRHAMVGPRGIMELFQDSLSGRSFLAFKLKKKKAEETLNFGRVVNCNTVDFGTLKRVGEKRLKFALNITFNSVVVNLERKE